MAGKLYLPPLPTISEVVRLYKLTARKQLSQNFLLDMNLCRKIARTAGNMKGAFVCEVGPGPGGITRGILDLGAHQVAVVEKDGRFLPSLQLLADAADHRLKIFQGDILKFDMDQVIPTEYKVPWHDNRPNIHIIGNLPFNVSTPLIIQWLEDISLKRGAWSFGRTKLTLTFQKEVGERLSADLMHPQRSRLSIMAQYLCHVRMPFVIPGRAFVPAPEVDAAVVTFIPRKEPAIKQPFPLVEKLVRTIFQHRRKQILYGIRNLYPPELSETLSADLVKLSGVEGKARPHTLSVPEVGALCDVYSAHCDHIPGLIQYDYRSARSVAEKRKSRSGRVNTDAAEVNPTSDSYRITS